MDGVIPCNNTASETAKGYRAVVSERRHFRLKV
jgi:hypothetical protein